MKTKLPIVAMGLFLVALFASDTSAQSNGPAAATSGTVRRFQMIWRGTGMFCTT